MSYVEYAYSELQVRIAKALDEKQSIPGWAKENGMDLQNAYRAVRKIKSRAAKKGFAPEHDMTKTAPDGFAVKGTSTLYDADGVKKIQWVKTNQDAERQLELMKEWVQGFLESVPPTDPKPLTHSTHTPDLLSAIFIGDAHIGMQAYQSETKHSDFDVDTACSQLRAAVDYLVDRAEPTETGLLVDVGDFLHPNGANGTTFNGTPLSTNLSYHGMMKAAGHVMRYMIDRMLTKFKNVVIVMAKGNHNADPAVGLQIAIDMLYSKEPRVKVLESDSFYHYIEYGNWLLGVHHGDKQKPDNLVSSMARDMSAAWGRTTHRLWCTGHFHKESVRTLPGCKHKVFGALPPPDSWHASQGYLGDGEMEMLTFRREGGLFSSHVYNIPQPRIEPDVKI